MNVLIAAPTGFLSSVFRAKTQVPTQGLCQHSRSWMSSKLTEYFAQMDKI
jgi:flagellar biosynthesis protein FliQ